ncbi:putative amidohydrolase YtcJ [Colletotrichum aenigma]|uniref:putative amidohydrolase YtcJ n=1 Tax=Colletotrichum aenigma TaxID=1215731 RepID=UPI001872EC31|nr:putative amidohydrolase YtcJ [Colletotrichum aenigma]KAF5512728.1 putative amidohydrolase YtcJ [Colletotrichum aenigma]
MRFILPLLSGAALVASSKTPSSVAQHRTRQQALPDVADFVFQNGSIYTLDSSSTEASALAIKNGTIIYVGDDLQARHLIGNDTKVLDLEGRMAMPGFVDVHMHVLQAGQNLLKCDFNYQRLSRQQVLDHLQECIDTDGTAQDTWLDAVNLNYVAMALSGESLTKADLDTLNTTRPMSLRSNDYHTFVLNSQPSGVLLDGANILIAGPPAFTDEKNAEAGRAALQILRQNGITTWQDALATNEHWGPWNILKESSELSSRGYFDYRIQPPSTLEAVDAVVAENVALLASRNDNSTVAAQPTLKWQAIKALLDGIMPFSARTAANTDPFWLPVRNGTNETQEWAPDPSAIAPLYWDPEILAKTLEGLWLGGVDAQLHVDGDRAVHVSLDAADAFRRNHPDAAPIRLALAHASLTLEEDWPRFAELGVDVVFQYQFSQLAPMWIPDTFNSIGEYRMGNLDAYAQIEEAGRPTVHGSDWPVDPLDVWLALKAGVTRRGDPSNPNSAASFSELYDGPFPGRGISRESVLKGATINGAKFLRADEQIGSLEVGKLADIIVTEKNFFEVPDEELGRNKVLLTMLGGEVVYLEDGAQSTFGRDVTPKFPNDNAVAAKMARRVIGGLHGEHLDTQGRAEVVKMRKRQGCGHEHAH